VFAAPASLFAGVLLFGALTRVAPEPAVGTVLWSGDVFATLGWLGVLTLVVSCILAWTLAEDRAGALAGVGVSGQLLLLSAALTIGLAVNAECQNYWDAYHFSSLAWTVALSSFASLAAVQRSQRLGSELGLYLRPVALASVGLSLLGWVWTESTALQGLGSEVARFLFLATHG
jgi:hypothetical protein